MINDVGKTAAIIKRNDYVINMVNASIDGGMVGGLPVYGEDGSLMYSFSVDSSGIGCRCLMFTRSLPGAALDTAFKPVLYVPPEVEAGTNGVPCLPLYECISPTSTMLVNGNYQITWWSNMDEMPTKLTNNTYVYNYTKIHRFNTNSLDDVQSTSSAYKILCTAPVYFEKLKISKYDDRLLITPIIRNIAIISLVSGEGYVVDFSTGDGSGGTKIHSHLNTQDCGFAGAVFMPAATPRVMSWS